MRHHQVRVIV